MSGKVGALCFGSLGFTGLDPGCGPMYHSSSHAVVTPHIEELEWLSTRVHNYVLGLWEEKRNRGRLATDVFSGPIFLPPKKKEKEKEIQLKIQCVGPTSHISVVPQQPHVASGCCTGQCR